MNESKKCRIIDQLPSSMSSETGVLCGHQNSHRFTTLSHMPLGSISIVESSIKKVLQYTLLFTFENEMYIVICIVILQYILHILYVRMFMSYVTSCCHFGKLLDP